jgi:hypothetical protein
MTSARAADPLAHFAADCAHVELMLARGDCADAACCELIVLTRLEQELLLPAAEAARLDEDMRDELADGIELLRDTVAQVLATPAGDPLRGPGLAVLRGYAKRHFGLLRASLVPCLRAAPAVLDALGRSLPGRREELRAVTDALREEAIATSFTG